MPDKRAFPPSVGKAIIPSLRRLAAAGLVAASVAWFAPGCTDNSGNGHFMQPQQDGAAGAAAGAGGGGATGGSGGGTAGAGGTSAGGSGGAGGGAAGAGGRGGAGGGTAGAGAGGRGGAGGGTAGAGGAASGTGGAGGAAMKPLAEVQAMCGTTITSTTGIFTVEDFCTLYLADCTGINAATGYTNRTMCEASFAVVPSTLTQCRSYHLCDANATLAIPALLTTHCDHATGMMGQCGG